MTTKRSGLSRIRLSDALFVGMVLISWQALPTSGFTFASSVGASDGSLAA
jgi:hypothetical protein